MNKSCVFKLLNKVNKAWLSAAYVTLLRHFTTDNLAFYSHACASVTGINQRAIDILRNNRLQGSFGSIPAHDFILKIEVTMINLSELSELYFAFWLPPSLCLYVVFITKSTDSYFSSCLCVCLCVCCVVCYYTANTCSVARFAQTVLFWWFCEGEKTLRWAFRLQNVIGRRSVSRTVATVHRSSYWVKWSDNDSKVSSWRAAVARCVVAWSRTRCAVVLRASSSSTAEAARRPAGRAPPTRRADRHSQAGQCHYDRERRAGRLRCYTRRDVRFGIWNNTAVLCCQHVARCRTLSEQSPELQLVKKLPKTHVLLLPLRIFIHHIVNNNNNHIIIILLLLDITLYITWNHVWLLFAYALLSLLLLLCLLPFFDE